MFSASRLPAFILIVAAAASTALAGPIDELAPGEAIICPAGSTDLAPPDFESPSCQRAGLHRIDAQNRMIWAAIVLEADASLLASGEPLAVFISAKASTDLYLNGAYIGSNGVPGGGKSTEKPGRMDAAIFAPREHLREGRNEIVMKMSGHHSLLRLAYPTHYVSIENYGSPSRHLLHYYWPSVLPLGALVLGAVYFGVCALRGEAVSRSLNLCAMAVFAAAQLFAEVSRGVFAYPYPVQDIRLILITVFSAGFGLCLVAHVFGKFARRLRLPALAASSAIIAVTIPFIPSFDAKAAISMFIPTGVSAVAALFWAFQRKSQAVWYFLALVAFIAVIFSFPSRFLDALFFYAVASLILFLLVEQAITLARERKMRRMEEMRAAKLELALEKAQEKSRAHKFKINNGRKTEFIDTSLISYCKGAGDYVEIKLQDGSQHLQSMGLNEMETSLPSSFLRVHRSYIVNTEYVQSLTRQSSGVGTLLLKTGDEVPVSRRILPKVRSALN